MMEWIGATILLLGALIGAFQVWMLLKAKKWWVSRCPILIHLRQPSI